MLDHISIGVNDLQKAKRFYDGIFKPLGYSCLTSGEGYLGYGKTGVQFWVLAAGKPVPANQESGLHFCFCAPTSESVDAFHNAAMAGGGADNGAPGIRSNYGENYYAAFVIDPEGYRLEAYYGNAPV